MPRPHKTIAIGERFGRLVVQRVAKRSGADSHSSFVCLCDCGRETIVWGANLIYGRTESCKCLQAEACGRVNLTHGMAGTPTYTAWQRMQSRCYNKADKRYADYGGRGITVCERWRGENGFENFVVDVGLRPSSVHSIDRWPDNNGSYEAGNVRWATQKQQQNNKRSNTILAIHGQSMTLTQWADCKGIKRATVWRRLKRGWSPEDALDIPARPMLRVEN